LRSEAQSTRPNMDKINLTYEVVCLINEVNPGWNTKGRTFHLYSATLRLPRHLPTLLSIIECFFSVLASSYYCCSGQVTRVTTMEMRFNIETITAFHFYQKKILVCEGDCRISLLRGLISPVKKYI